MFKEDVFRPEELIDKRTVAVVNAAVDRAAKRIRPSDILAAAIESEDARIISILKQALEPGSSPTDLKDLINVYSKPRSTPNIEFDGKQERFTSETLEALNQFETELSSCSEGSRGAALELLLSCVFSHTDEIDKEFLPPIINAEKAAKLFHKAFENAGKPLTPLFDTTSGRLRSDEFTEAAWTIMEHANTHAANMGYDHILPPHCFIALLRETEGIAENLVRLQAQPEIGPGKVADSVTEAFRLSDRKNDSIQLTQDYFGETTIELLRAAQKSARDWGEERIDTNHLMLALLETMPPRLASVLERNPLNLNLTKMRQHLDQQLRESKKPVKKEIAFRLPTGMLPSEDLTYKARTGAIPEALHLDAYFETIAKALYRRSENNILITGHRGVGKTTLVWELARRATTGKIPFLKRKRFLWIDCQDVSPKESRAKLEGILSYVASRTDLVLCLDGLDSILRSESGGNNKILLRGALKEKRINLIGIMTNWDFVDLMSSDHEMLEFFTRVNVEEPKKEATIDVVKKASAELEQKYKVTIEDKAIERAVILSADYILNERLPTKAIKILRRVCEDIDYERTQHQKTGAYVFCWDEILGNGNRELLNFLKENVGIEWAKAEKIEKAENDRTIKISNREKSICLTLNNEQNEVNLKINDSKNLKLIAKTLDNKLNVYREIAATATDVIRVISEISGVPEGTLSGIGDKEADYESDLSKEIVGQAEAVKAVATELNLIKAGLTEPNKPASVMFFAGLTGTGKTELAKSLARFYSSSKRLQTYTMGNFTESHTISGIIGVPPGYVGYDQGGRLINDLNADPYCVFLFDEAEKAHPDVWKPFLNLFDEGWVVDQRGVKAFADRAIFILTSNAGSELISKMSRTNKSMDAITEAVKDALSNIRREGTSQPVFPPEFLARIRRIIVFKPLDEDAMRGICQKLSARMIADWKAKREKNIIVPENLINYIAKQSHYEDEKSNYKEGGRIVRKMLRELVEASIQQEASKHEREYKACSIIELTFLTPEPSSPYQQPTAPKVAVRFLTEKSLSPVEHIAQAAAALRDELAAAKPTPTSIRAMVSDSLARIESAAAQWATEPAGEPGRIPDDLIAKFRKAQSDLEMAESRSEKESRAIVEELIRTLERATH